MNILNALKQLRDDIKAWVTVNLNALNVKIDEKTIPIDSELNSESANPVQNQAISKEIDDINKRVGSTSVSTQISQAINAQEHFSGNYNDLIDAPDIFEDGSGNIVITDDSGHIIFKVDTDGTHTTSMSLNGEAAATESYVDDAISKIDFPETDLTGYATEDFVNNAINNIEIPETDLSNYYNKEEVNKSIEAAKTELSESIVSESNEWKVADKDGNVIFTVDEDGAHTTSLTLNGESAATEKYVDDAINAIEIPEVNLTGYATEEFVNTSISNIEIPETDLSNYYNKEEVNKSIEDVKKEISESITSEDDEWKIADKDGNVIFSVDEDGAHTTSLTLNGERVIKESDLKSITIDEIDRLFDDIN